MTTKYDFAYSVGLVRTLETLLLNENEVERMVFAQSAKEAFKVLNEFDYADNKAGIEDPAEFQQVLNEGLMDIKTILTKITPDREILNIVLHQYDFHNIKTMLKAVLSGKSYEEIKNLLSEMGAIPVSALKNYIFDGQKGDFGIGAHAQEYICKKIDQAMVLFEKEGKNPQVIDLFLDRLLMKMIYGIAKDSKSSFLVEYVMKLIDLCNIRLFFRLKVQKKELQLFEIAFLYNGNVPFAKFREAYKKDLAEFAEVMKGGEYGKIVETGYRHFIEEKTFIYLEREIENHLTEFIKAAKLMPFGPEPLIAYLLAKKNNALIIRMIMVNKLNGVDPEDIKKRLRTLYR